MFKDVEGQLLPNSIRGNENVSKLLEDIRETIFDYQVRSLP